MILLYCFLLTSCLHLSDCLMKMPSKGTYRIAFSRMDSFSNKKRLTIAPMDACTTVATATMLSLSAPELEDEVYNSKLLYTRNMAFIKSLTESAEVIRLFQENSIVLTVDIEERCRSLRETIGLTRGSLKLYINKYPSICLDIFTTPVKSTKSVICRYLGISEAQYAASLRKIQAQTNSKAGSLFRGSFFFISSYLKSELNFDRDEIRQLFVTYPTFFVFSPSHISKQVQLLFSKYEYSHLQIKTLVKRNGRIVFYSDRHFCNLRVFLVKKVGISRNDFCSMTTKEPRLISSSLQRTIVPKYNQLLHLWKLPNEEIIKILKFAPNILTTKSSTSAKLHEFLKHEVSMSEQNITNFIKRYGGFLRVNVGTLRPKLITIVVIQLVCATFMIGETINEIAVSRRTDDELINNVTSIFKRASERIIERDAIVLTFSKKRIVDRLLRVLPKLNFKRIETRERVIFLIHQILQERSNDKDARMHTFINRYISEVGHLFANLLVESAVTEELFIPINPQYSISYNDEKFKSWLEKLNTNTRGSDYSG